MNKLFSKIAVFAVGAAMAVGLGVAASRSFAEVKATEKNTTFTGAAAFDSAGDGEGKPTLTWSVADGNLQMIQHKGNGTNPNNTYNTNARVYMGNYLEFKAINGYKILSVEITVDSTYYGNNVTAGLVADPAATSPNNPVADDSTNITKTLTTTSGGKHIFASVATAGVETFYVGTSYEQGGKQLRWNSGGVKIIFDEPAQTGTITSVTVFGPGDETELNYTSGYLGKVGAQLHTVVEKEGLVSTDVTWESANPSVVSVTSDGFITVLGNSNEGVSITATSVADNTKSGSILVRSNLSELPANSETTNFTTSVYGSENIVTDGENTTFDTSTLSGTGLSLIKLVADKSTCSSNPGYYKNSPTSLRFYTDSILRISSDSQFIKCVEFTSNESNPLTAAKATLNSGNFDYVLGTSAFVRCGDDVDELTLTFSGTVNFTSIKIYFEAQGPSISPTADKNELAKGEVATITTTLENGASGVPTYVADPAAAVALTPSVDGLTCTVTALSVESTTDVTITVSLAGCDDKQVVIAVLPDATIVSIAVTTPPTKNTYNSGETINLEGLVVTATYDNSNQEVISNDLLNVEYDFDVTVTGPVDVTLKLKADETITTSFQVTVNAIEELTFATAVTYMSGLDAPTTAEGTNYYPANCTADAATIFDVVGFVSGKRSSDNGKTVYIADTIEHAETQTNEIQAYHITISDEDYASLTVGSEVKIRGKLAVFSTSKTMEIMESSITIINIRPIVPAVKTVAESLTMIKAITPPPENNKTAYVSSWQTYQVDGYVVEVYDTNRTLKILDSADGTSSEKLEVTFIEQSLYNSLKTIGTKIRAVGLLAWYKNNNGASRYQLANYTSVEELEPAPVITPIDVNVAGAIDALKDVTPANPVAMLSNTQTYAVTGYVKNLVGWSDTYKNGNIYMVDSSDGTGTAEVQAYHVGGYDTEDEFKAAFVKGTKIKVTGLLGAFLKNDGGTTYEIVNPVVEILQPPVVKPISLTYEGTLTKTEYEIGEDFDTTLAGITKFIVTYSDDTQTNPHKVEKELSALNVDTSAFDKTTAGDYTIKVSYTEEGETVFFLLAVEVKGEEPGPGPQPVEPTLESISVVNEQTDYFVGETFNFSALSVTLVFDDESTEAGVLGTNYTLVYPQGFNGTFTEAGTFVFTVKAVEDETITASFTVTVSNVPVVLDHITATCTVTEYTVGDQISADTLTVTAYFSDGSSQVITTGYTVTFDSSVAGENVKVTVSYTSEGVTKSASFYVTVKNAPAKKGCGGDIAATSIILSTLSLAGVALLALKKRKED